jgi:hypothetical protein
MGSAAAPPLAPIYGSDTPYRSHPAPTYTPVKSTTGFTPAPAPERPQFAQFDASTGKPVHEDSLPHMPSWREASSKKIEVEELVEPEKPGDLEMNRFDNNEKTGYDGFNAVVGASPRSPTRPLLQQSPSQERFGTPGPYQQNGSFVGAAPQRSYSPYGQAPLNGRAQSSQQQGGYRGLSPVHALSTPAAVGAPYGQNNQYGRSSPNPALQSGRNQNRSPVSPLVDRGYGAPPVGQAIEMPSPSMHQTGAGAAPSHFARSNSPGYAPSGSTRYEAPSAGYPGQQTYQAFQPSVQELDSRDWQGQQRKPVNGSWKDV